MPQDYSLSNTLPFALQQGIKAFQETKADVAARKAAQAAQEQAMQRQGMMDERYTNEQATKTSQFDQEMDLKRQQMAQQAALSREGRADKADAKKIAKRPGEVTVRNLSEGKLLPGELTNVEGLLNKNRGLFGPMVGRAGSVNPYNEPAQAVNSQIKAAAQMIGRYMEGGVLRAEDLPKYAAMLPALSDTPETAQNKINNVRALLERKYNTDLESLQQGGYDVSGFEKMQAQQQGGQDLAPGAVEDGYQYIGGDKADPASWKKVQ